MGAIEIAAALLALLLGPGLAADLFRRVRRVARLRVARRLGQLRPFSGPARVVDGDTLVVAGSRVRLFGIDAPDGSQPAGELARAHLARLVGTDEVRVVPLDSDRRGRIVGTVRRDGRDLSRAMVADGFARAAGFWSWTHVPAELLARGRGRGLWAGSRLRGIGSPARYRAAWRRFR